MPNDDITGVVIDGNKLDQSNVSQKRLPTEEEKKKKGFLDDLFVIKFTTGDEVRGEGKGALGLIDAPSTKDMKDFADYDKANKKLEEAQKAAGVVQKSLLKHAEATKCASDFNSIREPEKRYEQATGFVKALKQVPAVETLFTTIEGAALVRMDEATKRDKKNSGPVKGATTPDQWNTLRLKAMQGRSLIRVLGLPDGYAVSEGPEWHKTLIGELEPFTKGNDAVGNEQLRKDFRDKAPTQQAKLEAGTAGKDFKEAVEKYQARGMNRASLYFDATRNGVPLSLDDEKKAKAAIEKLSKLGVDILNNGGSYKQVKELMAESGLSEEFWPPQLVQAIQAWRKTSRALQEERARKLAEGSKTGKGLEFPEESVSLTMKMIAGFTELDDAMREIHKDQSDDKDKSGLISAAAENAEVLKKVSEWMNASANGVTGALSVVDLMKTIAEMYKTGKEGSLDLETALKELDLAMEGLAQGLTSALAGMNMAKDLAGPAVHELMKKVVPGLGLAVAGVDFVNALKDLGKNSRTLSQTRGQKNEGLAMFVTDDVDEAMLFAMNNALSAERTKVAKSSIKVGTSGMEVAGNAATTFGGHFGAAAGAAISITATGIEMGSKAIFSGIDWGKANKAKKMLAEARAGNMEAQVEIFEKSNFYAKMFLAISVKEGSPLAKKYVFDRGIEEGDLDKPQSLEVLRDAMLDAADQDNEQETEDSLAMHFGGSLAKLAVGTGEKIGGLGTNVKDRIVRGVTKTYNKKAPNNAAAFTDKPDEWAATWESAKATHIANGLIDESTGLTEALTKAAEAHKAADLQPNDKDAKAKLLAAMDAMNKVLGRNLSAKPVGFEAEGSPKRVPHTQAYDSLKQLRVQVNQTVETYWHRLDTLPGADPNWTPAAIASVTAAEWRKFWSAGGTAVAFPAEDAGVAKAIEAAEAAKKAYLDEKDPRKQRRLAVTAVVAFDDVNEALLDCLDFEAVNRRDSARAAINALMLKVNAERQLVDAWLAGKTEDGLQDAWNGPTPNFSTLDPKDYLSEFENALEYAFSTGFMATGVERGKGDWDGGLDDALLQWQLDWRAYTEAAKSGTAKELLRTIRSLQENAGRVKKRALKFLRVQRAAADQVKALCQAVSEAVVRQTVTATESFEKQKAPDFELPKGKTPLSSDNWCTVHDNAVAAGAVLKSGAGRKALREALKERKKAEEAYAKGLKSTSKDKPKKLRPIARTYAESLNEVDGVVDMVRGLKRYGQNAKMARYLDSIKSAVDQARKDAAPDLAKYAGGTAVPTVMFTAAKLDADAWSKNKDIAVSNGVISGDKTGVKGALEDYIKAGNDKAKKRPAALKLRPLLEEAGNDSEYKPWHDYIEKMLELVVEA